MNHHFWVDPNHVGAQPSEVIMMLLEEVYETFAEVWPKIYPNLDLVIWQVKLDWNFIVFLLGRLLWIYVACRCRL